MPLNNWLSGLTAFHAARAVSPACFSASSIFFWSHPNSASTEAISPMVARRRYGTEEAGRDKGEASRGGLFALVRDGIGVLRVSILAPRSAAAGCTREQLTPIAEAAVEQHRQAVDRAALGHQRPAARERPRQLDHVRRRSQALLVTHRDPLGH